MTELEIEKDKVDIKIHSEIQVLNDINEISPQFFLKTNDQYLDNLIVLLSSSIDDL